MNYMSGCLNHWVPGNSPDLDHFTDLQKGSWFPRVEDWFRRICQPCALPIPTPPSMYYFHTEIRDAQRFSQMADSERVRRLCFCAEEEFYVLFLAMWWNDLVRGGRAFVVHPETINILQEHCGSVLDIVGKPAQAIIERMRMFADLPRHYHNWICFSDRSLEASPFIFAVKNSGAHDHNTQCGRRIWCRRDHRSMSVSRYTSTTYKRLTLLEGRLSGPELDEVPGLLSLVREQDWARYNAMRVGELLQSMVGLYNHTRLKLDESERCLSHEKRCHEDTRRDLGEAKDDVSYLNGRLDDTKYALEAANSHSDRLVHKLDDAHREINYWKENRADPRSIALQRNERYPSHVHDGMRSPQYSPNRDIRMDVRNDEPAPARNRTGGNAITLEIPRVRAPTGPVNTPYMSRVASPKITGTLRASGERGIVDKRAVGDPSSPFIAPGLGASNPNTRH